MNVATMSDDERAAMHARLIEALSPAAPRIDSFFRRHVDGEPLIGWYLMWCHICDIGAGWGKKATPEQRELFSLFIEAVVGTLARSPMVAT